MGMALPQGQACSPVWGGMGTRGCGRPGGPCVPGGQPSSPRGDSSGRQRPSGAGGHGRRPRLTYTHSISFGASVPGKQ